MITTSDRLQRNISKIMDTWVIRADQEVLAAHHQDTLALKSSLPEYLSQLVMALSNTIDRNAARKYYDKKESTRVGKKHGKERAETYNYTMDQLILEYHILRQVICDVMEEEAILTPVEREVIVCSFEQAVNDAATEFSNTINDMQEKLSQILSHDLRNPIAAAKVSASLILRAPAKDSYSIKCAERISSCMDRVDKMISDLLDTSRFKAGENLHLDFKECDLDWIIREVAIEANIVHNVPIEVISDNSCKGLWNEDGLRRMLENLLTNAVKYGLKGGLITISLKQQDDSVSLSIHNQGDPIPKEEIPFLFHKFHRSKSVEEKSGWGLGLTMVEGMVEAHKGTILVESDDINGTSFIIHLFKNF